MSDTCDLLCLDLPRAESLRRRRLEVADAAVGASRAKALADPTRLMLAVALRDAEGELCVCDLSWVAERSEKLVSHHVRVLRVAGLGRSRRGGKMGMYALTTPARAGGGQDGDVRADDAGSRARRFRRPRGGERVSELPVLPTAPGPRPAPD